MVNVLLRSAGRDMKTEVVPQVFFFSFSFYFLFLPLSQKGKDPIQHLQSHPSLCVAAGPRQRLPAEGWGCSLRSDAAM